MRYINLPLNSIEITVSGEYKTLFTACPWFNPDMDKESDIFFPIIMDKEGVPVWPKESFDVEFYEKFLDVNGVFDSKKCCGFFAVCSVAPQYISFLIRNVYWRHWLRSLFLIRSFALVSKLKVTRINSTTLIDGFGFNQKRIFELGDFFFIMCAR